MSKDSLFLLGIGEVWRYSSNQLRGFDVKTFLVGFHAVQNPWDWDQCWDNSTASHHNKSLWLPALMQIVQQNIASAHPVEAELWIISRSYKWEWKQIFFPFAVQIHVVAYGNSLLLVHCRLLHPITPSLSRNRHLWMSALFRLCGVHQPISTAHLYGMRLCGCAGVS